MSERTDFESFFYDHPDARIAALGETTQDARTATQEGITGSSQWPDPPAKEAYHGLAGDVVRRIEPHTEASPVALLIQTLLSFGNLVGRTAHFVAEASQHFPNLFAVLVGVTSVGRKGSSWAQVLRLFRMIDPEWAGGLIQFGLSSGEGLIWAVRDPITRHEPIRDKGHDRGLSRCGERSRHLRQAAVDL